MEYSTVFSKCDEMDKQYVGYNYTPTRTKKNNKHLYIRGMIFLRFRRLKCSVGIDFHSVKHDKTRVRGSVVVLRW